MIFNIVIKENNEDNFSPESIQGQKVIALNSFQNNLSNNDELVSYNLTGILKKQNLKPSENAIDFINLGLASYVSDQLVSRKDHGYFDWGRYFKIYLPVLNLERWEQAKCEVEKFLSFLSGDKWELLLRERKNLYGDFDRAENEIEKVCLLSGGLDSFVGATDLLANGCKNIAFASHHKKGNSGENGIQKTLINLLKDEFPKSNLHPNYFYVQAKPTGTDSLKGESSQRARSIIFIALALAIANSYSNDIPIIIPENGLISLNVPLTYTRSGSHSTKTTHPYYIESINNLFNHLEINNKLTNPYRFQTKGEMILNSSKQNFILEHAYKTISCSKPGLYVQRFHKKEKHCGHCTPCIIRRAALNKVNSDSFENNYVRDVLRDKFRPQDISSRDIVAFKIALSRISKNNKSPIFNLLKSGPIPADDKDLNEYLGTYKRGMDEVKDFINSGN